MMKGLAEESSCEGDIENGRPCAFAAKEEVRCNGCVREGKGMGGKARRNGREGKKK